jgi:hypothetical protein
MGCKDRHIILIDNSLLANIFISVVKPAKSRIKSHFSSYFRTTGHALKVSFRDAPEVG